MNTPIIPHKDVDFDRVSGLVVADVTQKATQWCIPTQEVTTLSDSHSTWHAAYEKSSDPVPARKASSLKAPHAALTKKSCANF
jgi:hypothetical protein